MTHEVQLSVVVPTFNERANVARLVEKLDESLSALSWEAIFVDDGSPDGTGDEVRRLARSDRRVRLVMRHNRRGLSSAVVEGALASSAEIVAVMDGDLQHDERVLTQLYEKVASGETDIASASRFLQEASADGLSSENRVKMSEGGISIANRVFGLDLTDPLTGFFAMRREAVVDNADNLSEIGFKILLDLIVSSRPRLRVQEVPFTFRKREHGESKLDEKVLYDFFLFFLEKTIGRFIPVSPRFFSFAIVGGLGVIVHMATLSLVYLFFGFSFVIAQTAATSVALFFNYFLNNQLTYFDKRLKGVSYWIGFLRFVIVCSVGMVGNIGVASYMHERLEPGLFYISALGGIAVGVVWNFVVSRIFVWKD